jgi:hypothetical protein
MFHPSPPLKLTYSGFLLLERSSGKGNMGVTDISEKNDFGKRGQNFYSYSFHHLKSMPNSVWYECRMREFYRDNEA